MRISELPSPYEVGKRLQYIDAHSYYNEDSGEDSYIDIRLAVKENGSWHIFVGSPDYDSWHGAVCGASCIDISKANPFGDLMKIAYDLLDQCAEQCH